MKGLAVIVGIISLAGILHAWSIGDDISSGTDGALAITADDNYIYIAGYDEAPGNLEIRIQKRNKSDGSIVWQRWNNISSGWDQLKGITSDDDYIYVVGYDELPGESNTEIRIQKRNKSDGSLVWERWDNVSSGDDEICAIVNDANYIYTAGYDDATGDNQWRIERRNKSDGTLQWVQQNDYPGWDYAWGIAVDYDYVYIVGNSESGWVIEKRDKTDGSLVWNIIQNNSGIAYGIAVDESFLYTVGYTQLGEELRIQKRSKSDGSLVWERWNDLPGVTWLNAIAIDENHIYVTGVDEAAEDDLEWRIEKRNKSDGAPVWVQQIDFSPGRDEATGIAADNDYIYLCGKDNIPGSDEWRIEKRNKSDGSVTGIEEERAASFPTLMQIAPNPFRELAAISLQLPAKGKASIGIYDATGRLIKSFKAEPGNHRLIWHRDNLPSRVYFCRLTTGGFSITQKLILR